jgi:hypothetical protein
MAASYRQLRSRGSQFGGRGRTDGFNSAGHRCGIEGGNPPQGGYYSLETKTTGRVTEFSIFQPEPEKHRASQGDGAGGFCMFWSRTVGSYRVTALVAFMVSVALCACTVLLLITWTEPLLDDFCRASFAVDSPQAVFPAYPLQRGTGIINHIIWNYFMLSGRWAGLGFETLILSTTRLPGAYPWVVFSLIVAQYLFLYLAMWNFVEDARLTLYLSALIASAYWANMPSPEEGIFWVPGAVEDQLPLTLGLVLFSFILSRHPSAKAWSTRYRIIAASGLGLVTPAFHELAGGVLVLALSAITASAFSWGSSDRKMWLTVWAATAIGFLVVFVAPGNFHRLNLVRMETSTNYLMLFHGLLREIRRYILPWCLDFKHWLLAVVIWFDPGVASVRAKFSGMSSFRAIAGFALVWLLSIVMILGVPIYIVGQPAGRTLNFTYGVFLIGWITLAFLLTRPHPRFSLQPAYRVIALSSALFLFSALVLTSNNTVTSMLDIISGRARSWSAEMNNRFTALKTAGRSANLFLPPISARPVILSAVGDINEKPDYWANQCLSLYFGVSSVQVSTSPN